MFASEIMNSFNSDYTWASSLNMSHRRSRIHSQAQRFEFGLGHQIQFVLSSLCTSFTDTEIVAAVEEASSENAESGSNETHRSIDDSIVTPDRMYAFSFQCPRGKSGKKDGYRNEIQKQ